MAAPPAAPGNARMGQRKYLFVPLLVGFGLVIFVLISGNLHLSKHDVRHIEAQFFRPESSRPLETNKTTAAVLEAENALKLKAQDDAKKAEEAASFEKQAETVMKANQTETVVQKTDEPKNETAKADEPAKTDEKKTSETTAEPKEKKSETTSKEDKPKKPLNIVLLYADDMRHDSLGIAGTQVVKTPSIDQLAREGIRFTHNCVTTSVCWISRATLYTGMYLSRHLTTMPFTETFYKYWNQTWPSLLNAVGYHVGHVGKWHHGDSRPVEKSYGFWKSYYGRHVLSDGTHITKKNELDSLEFLQKRPKDKPFMLSTCFFAPHAWDGNPAVWVPQNSSMELYKHVNVPLPESYTEKAWKDMPDFFTDRNEARTRFFQRFKTPEMYQDMIKNYYRLISEIDYATGKIVEELERQGVLNETMIIFTTDNGFFHGEHLMAGKWYPHEESLRVPLVIKDPRIPKDKIGTTNDEFTLNVDLAETILGAAGLEAPDTMQGRDIADLYAPDAKDKTKWRTEFFYEHPVHLTKEIIPASTAVVRKNFKYITWPNYKVEQLFDMMQDPMELNNVINDTVHVARLADFRKSHKELSDAIGYKETVMTECC